MVHELKTEPEHYAAQKAMIKPFEVRKMTGIFKWATFWR